MGCHRRNPPHVRGSAMKRLDIERLAEWCAASGYFLQGWDPGLSAATKRYVVALPSAAQHLTELIDDLVAIDPHSRRLVWIRDWTIWGERSQEIGLRHLELLVDTVRLPPGDRRPDHLYMLEPSEWRETIALLTVPSLYGWDAFLFFESGAALVEFSHEGRISIALSGPADGVLAGWLVDDSPG